MTSKVELDTTTLVSCGGKAVKEEKESGNMGIFEYGQETGEAGSSDTCPLVRSH